MPKLAMAPGVTSQTVNVFIQDSSVTTNVAGRTGLVFNTAGLTCYYVRTRSASVAVTLATLASASAAWATGGFIEIDATNAPGMYRLDIPDAALASGARFVTIYLRGASNMVPCILEIDLQADANVTHYGGTAGTFSAGRPEVNTTHWGGTAIASANVRANVVQVAGQTASAAGAVTFPGTIASTTNITAATGVVLSGVTHTGAVIPTVTTTGTATNLTNLPSIPANWLTAAGIAAGALNGKGDWNIGKTGYALTQSFPANFASLAITAGGAVTAGTVSDKTGYSLAAAGLDSVVIETGLNARQALSIVAASAAGTLSGAATTTITIDGAGVSTDRIVATVDASGNRTAVTLSPPA